MGLMRRLFWAVCLMALGAGLATVQVAGKTPLQHLGAVATGPVWQALKSGAGMAYDRARGALASKPVETHSPEDRDALNKLIAKRASP
jgi:hypothetical protein